MATVRGLSLPIQAYVPSAAEMNIVQDATEKLIARCMGQFGFTWTYQPSHMVSVNQADREIGVSDLGTALEYGYSLPPADGGQPGGGVAAKSAPVGGGGALPTAELLVLSGNNTSAPASYHGEKVPRGGCAGQARMNVSGVDQIDPSGLVASIGVAMWRKALADTRVVTVFKKWSACMSGKGYRYATPLDAAGDPRWPSAGTTPMEIQAAVADVECKQRDNVIGVWFPVESGYENEAIQLNIQQLTTIKNQWTSASAKAAQILGAPAPQGP
jgi:hypothetical protein